MNKGEEIIRAFKNSLFSTEQLDEIAKERFERCKECPHKKDYTCGLCKCVLTLNGIEPFGKPYSPKNSCPDGRWKR